MIAFGVVALIGIAGLLIAAGADERRTAFSVDVPNARPVVTLLPGERACQRPVVASAAFRGLAFWVNRTPAAGATLLVGVDSSAGAPLALGAAHVPPATLANPSVRLTRTVPAGATVSLCFQDSGPAPVSLRGATPVAGSGALERDNRTQPVAAAIVLLRPRPRSMLDSLSAIFARAALFRPTWMGEWTYWLLLALLIAAFPLAAGAVALAAREDQQP